MLSTCSTSSHLSRPDFFKEVKKTLGKHGLSSLESSVAHVVSLCSSRQSSSMDGWEKMLLFGQPASLYSRSIEPVLGGNRLSSSLWFIRQAPPPSPHFGIDVWTACACLDGLRLSGRRAHRGGEGERELQVQRWRRRGGPLRASALKAICKKRGFSLSPSQDVHKRGSLPFKPIHQRRFFWPLQPPDQLQDAFKLPPKVEQALPLHPTDGRNASLIQGDPPSGDGGLGPKVEQDSAGQVQFFFFWKAS